MTHDFDNFIANDEECMTMTPAALLWLEEFEQANSHCNRARLWRDLHARAKGRGTAMVKGLDWPGMVHVPSSVMDGILQKGSVHLPDRWTKFLDKPMHGKLLALLSAWEVERGIYRFTPCSYKLVSNSCVTASLQPAMFEGMPAQAIYVDLTEFGTLDESRPWGFFAGIDQIKPGQLDLVLAIDRYTHLDVQTIELTGKTIDEIVTQALKRARMQTSNSRAWAESEARESESTWHWLISAVLMTCINQNRMKIVPDQSSKPFQSTREPWVSWEVGNGIDEQIQSEMRRAGGNINASESEALIIGQWCQPVAKEALRLQFSTGCQFNWSDLERRHGSNGGTSFLGSNEQKQT